MSQKLKAAGVRLLTVIALVLCVVPASQAGPVKVGLLQYQNWIPASTDPALPGANAFWLYWNSLTLLPLSNVTMTVAGTDAGGAPINLTIGGAGAFDPSKFVGDPTTNPSAAFSTDAKITTATLTGDVENGFADWAGQRYTINKQSVTATLTNASGLVPFPLGPDGTGDQVEVTAIPTPRSYYLAEGAQVWTFDTQFALANRGKADAPVRMSFLRELSATCPGGPIEITLTVPMEARATVRAAEVPGLAACSFSTVITSEEGVPLSVERTMVWDGGHGAHAGTAAEALSPVWYFAEGVQSWMDTYLLIANPNTAPTTVSVTFFLAPTVDDPNPTPVYGELTIAAQGRGTVWTGHPALAALRWRSFGMMITATEPVVAERAVYFGRARRWDGGTLAMGVTAPSNSWYFGEGALGSGFDEYLLLSNPSAVPATVSVQYLPERGQPVTLEYYVGPQARTTVVVTAQPLGYALPNGLGMQVTSAVPILAERAMYLRPRSANWHDGHASPGSTELGTIWEVADCVVGDFGSATNAQTFILLSNPSAEVANVTVTYSREGGKAAVPVDHTVPAGGRLTVYSRVEKDPNGVPWLSNERFGAGIVVNNGVPIVVERSVYWDARGLHWAAATNTLGTKLQ